ncbi:MAG: hypothetical protein LBK64_06010, partial [Spirochaetaceae bacterium]|nr:hypothetical protein [Spirochaetaceae bacterium]
MFVRKPKQSGKSRAFETLKKLIPLFFFAAAGLLASCSQDSIFYEISNEVAPKDPLIPGGPSQIVEHGTNKLYVARKYVYTYNNSSGSYRWSRLYPSSSFDGDAIDIASDGTNLFVLTMKDWGAYSMRLWISADDGVTWNQVQNNSSYDHLENIYGSDNTLFAGAFDGTGSRNYGVLYYNSGNLVPCRDTANNPIRERLGGAAKEGSNYYVAAGSTLYYGTSPSSFAV